MDLPVERVSEIELYLGLAPGSLLVDAGYISQAAARQLSDPGDPENKDNADRSKKKDGINHKNHPAGDGSRGRAHRQAARTTDAVPPADRDFVDSLVDWLFDYRQLIEALALVRETEPEASAVAGISQLRKVAELRTSWELWEHISRRSSDQIREIVERELAPSTVDLIRFAIWNEPPRYTRSARRLDG